MEYYDDFLIKIPQSTIKWRENHKESESNIDVVLNKAEVKQILDYLKLNHFTYYIIFRIFAETGMRKGELINIDYNAVDLKKRFIKTNSKRGTKIYYISSDLKDYLEAFIRERKLIKTKDKALFISSHLQRYENRAFNQYLLKVLGKVGIDKNVTCHTFRRTLNTLRKLMGCSTEGRKILINHKVSDVNINHYVKLNYEQYIQLYDRWNPFNDIVL